MYTLADGRRGLRGAAVSFHLNRPGMSFGAIGFAGRPLRFLTGMSGMGFRAHNLAAPDDLSRSAAHKLDYSELGSALQYH